MSFYESVLKPVLFTLPPEIAHDLGMRMLRAGLGLGPVRSIVAKRTSADGVGPVERFGLTFANPLGIAAGFDKNGKAAGPLAALGFGFVEVGTVTLEPQPGNPKPRLFRLAKDEALINRLGFNNEGARAVARRLERHRPVCVLGVNIGRNKDVSNEAAVSNYLETFKLVHPVADYIAVNVSSPNTPGLRDLQGAEALNSLLEALQECNEGFKETRPILLKIAPDLTDDGIGAAVDAAISKKVSGIIATNTTTGREGLQTPEDEIAKIGAGGLSGRPIRRRSCDVIRQVRRFSNGKLDIIGVGGIFTAEDAFEKITAGASLVQAYTGFVYRGPGFARDVNEGLTGILKDRGFHTLDDAVGRETAPERTPETAGPGGPDNGR